MANIEPKTLKGFRDFAPKDKIVRDLMIDKIKKTFELFGYLPLETPTLEFKEILSGDYGEDEKLMYAFTDHGGREVAMRFDLTVPFARFVAQNRDLTLPFKRYQIAPVWRGENTQAGRYREFYQCDVDIVGADESKSDLEIVLLTEKVLSNLDVGKIIIRVNNRKLFSALMEKIAIDKKDQTRFLQKIDKLDKIGLESVIEQIKELGVKEQSLEPVKMFLSLPQIWPQAMETLKGFGLSEIGQEGIKELDLLFISLDKLGFDQKKIVFDPSIVRGLGYYTGLVIETRLSEAPNFGSIAGGGRYDNLMDRFTDKALPAIGISFGIDRLIAALEELGKISKESSVSKVLLITLSSEFADYANKIADNLRKQCINTEIYLGSGEDISKQLKYASSLSIPFAIIIGENEARDNTATLKNMTTGEQQILTLDDIASKLQTKE